MNKFILLTLFFISFNENYDEMQCIIASYIGRLQYGDCQSLLHNNIKV